MIKSTPDAIRATIYFAHNSAALQGTNRAAVEHVSRRLSGLNGATATVDGHASSEGSGEYNAALSRRRRTVVTALLGSELKKKMDFGGEGHGETHPAVPETATDTAALERQRAQNRRVEIVIMRQGSAALPWRISPDREPGDLPGPQGWEVPRELQPGPADLPGPRKPPHTLPPSLQSAAEKAGAPRGLTFEELVAWLEENSPSKHLAPRIARFATEVGPLVGHDPKELAKQLREAARSGIEAGIKEMLKMIVKQIAGSSAEKPPLDTGPGGVTEIPPGPVVKLPIPFPGDNPPRPRQRAALTITDKDGPTMTKLNYRPGEFIAVSVTTAGWLPRGRAIVEIVAADGKRSFARGIVAGGRSNVHVRLAVPDQPGRYQSRLRDRRDRSDMRDKKWFTVRGKSSR
jgi:hypothetical protein